MRHKWNLTLEIFTFYCSSIKGVIELLTDDAVYIYLHSTVVLLKDIEYQPLIDINSKFTFYCSSIKGICGKNESFHNSKIYILL